MLGLIVAIAHELDKWCFIVYRPLDRAWNIGRPHVELAQVLHILVLVILITDIEVDRFIVHAPIIPEPRVE